MRTLCKTILCAAIGLAGAPLLTPAPAQVGPEHPPLPGGGGPGAGGEQQARQEMMELFGKVETRLKEIDALLYDASAGQSGLAGADETVIGELLQQSSSKSEEVLSGIDRILEIASQFGSGQGGSCQSAMQEGGDSPLDKRSQGEQGEKEKTPEIGPDGERPEQQQPESQPGQEQPDSPRESLAPPENRDAASAPPQGETGRVEVTDSAERWGDLPVHVRDLFRSEGGRDMPAQYRDWIDGYYRRLNKRR